MRLDQGLPIAEPPVVLQPVVLGSRTCLYTTPDGYTSLERWAQSFGDIAVFAVEGTGSWGAGLVRHLRDRGHGIVEVNRPDRSARRRQSK